MTLFDISSEFYVLKDLLDNDLEYDPETGEVYDNSEVLQKLFEEVSLKLGDKLDNSQRVVLELNGKADTLDKEIKRLQDKKRAFLNSADRLKSLMQNAIISSGKTKIKTDLFSFFIRESEALSIADEDNIPRQFLRIKKEVDKVAIKKAIKDGEEIDGCYIVKNRSLGVK